nr:immunoglobulin light chain junction region [Macaca mulatta]MOV62467.1 immunoglobulin light chain junction region [Macaca mulatta]MOV62800.1 immunoglobulin light chain junction region [Macaca mulatta]MOV63085.1 immunoglobulin light chain junction region [Macaca mulatta]MOV63230.1 immunoglobulin light chain junction region [Macaca mulatta]
CQQHNRYPFTF